MQLYQADIWHDDAIALAVELSRDLHTIYNTVVKLAGAQDMSYSTDDSDVTGYSRIQLRVRMDMRGDQRTVKVGINWPMATNASSEETLQFATILTRVACVASDVEARIKRFFAELRPDPISEEKREAQHETARRRNMMADSGGEVEMSFAPAERSKLKRCAAVLNVRHRRGKTSLVSATDLGRDYLQHMADSDNEASRSASFRLGGYN